MTALCRQTILPERQTVRHASLRYLNFLPRGLIEFLAGVALCRLRPRVPQAIGLLTATVALAYVLPALPGLGNGPWPLLWRQVAIVAGGGALICSLARDGWLSRILDYPLLVIGGEISYSMYMTHQLAMIIILPIAASWNFPMQFCLVFGIVIAISTLLFYLVETPARDAAKHWLRDNRRKSVAFGKPVAEEG
jgi:peptidoglycan/LPS O-acetylase OafA/YrhL